jgi:acetamidase/formamidase
VPTTHHLPDEVVHFTWDVSHEPVLEIDSGDTAPLTPRVDTAPFYGTTGVGPDLYVCAQEAVRAMVEHISTTYDLGREDAYLLSSLVVDLKISEIVDAGQYIVSALLPEAVFTA